jgi:nucleotide-binding universal stress UspA family protein
MYKHILIATDGSELAGRALAHGLVLAKELKAAVTLVTVNAAMGSDGYGARCSARPS